MSAKRTFFEEDELKDCIEKILYSGSGIVSNAIVLSGPNCERHIKNLRRSICISKKSKIIVVEASKNVYHTQKEWVNGPEAKKYISVCLPNKKYRRFRLDEKVSIVYNAITEIPPERFIDADLMGSLSTQAPIVTQLLDQQVDKYKPSNLKKGLIFTFSSRRTSTKALYSYLKWLTKTRLKTSLTFSSKIALSKHSDFQRKKWLKHICLPSGGRVINIDLYSYKSCNGHPMVTGLIVYK